MTEQKRRLASYFSRQRWGKNIFNVFIWLVNKIVCLKFRQVPTWFWAMMSDNLLIFCHGTFCPDLKRFIELPVEDAQFCVAWGNTLRQNRTSIDNHLVLTNYISKIPHVFSFFWCPVYIFLLILCLQILQARSVCNAYAVIFRS